MGDSANAFVLGNRSDGSSLIVKRARARVQVRLTCKDQEGTWALFETKQKLYRDGRVRPRNRPLAEKKRPGEPVSTVLAHE